MRYRILLTLLMSVAMSLSALAVGPVPEAQACGGFFCNAGTQSPIYQAGERVVFAMNEEGGVTMHIEIAYEGEPTDFGWIMPIEAPLDESGEVKPLEEILQVSTSELFDRLATATDPRYVVNNRFEDQSCQQDPQGFDTTTFDTVQDSSADFGSDTGQPPPVAVLQEANVGPYGAQLIRATSADALYTWLEEEGYIQDPTARPLLDHYVQQEFVFLALKLQNGKSAGDIRPVQLELGETYACVPLRLTAIAATPDMPMLVWVLGPERAVPKNFLHAVVNPLALTWPGGSNYVDIVSQAVNEIEGRAFVTEFATEDDLMAGIYWNDNLTAIRSDVQAAQTLEAVLSATQRIGNLDNRPELRNVFESLIPMPEGLTGFPYGNCYYNPSWDGPIGGEDAGSDGWGQSCPPNEEHLTTPAEFYGYLDYWIEELAIREMPLDVDVEALKAALEEGWFAPRERIQAMFDRSAWITRFFTTISPSEMSRDPIFAFNPDLPPVAQTHTLETVIGTGTSCDDWRVDATYPDGSEVRFQCSNWRCTDRSVIGPVPGESALARVEVLDETGEPMPFDPSGAADVDMVLAFATPGSSSLPAGYELPPVPEGSDEPRDLNVDTDDGVMAQPDGSAGSGCGCTTVRSDASPWAPAIIGVTLIALLAIRRRCS